MVGVKTARIASAGPITRLDARGQPVSSNMLDVQGVLLPEAVWDVMTLCAQTQRHEFQAQLKSEPGTLGFNVASGAPEAEPDMFADGIDAHFAQPTLQRVCAVSAVKYDAERGGFACTTRTA